MPVGTSGSGSVVEHLLAKEGVASSNLVFRSIFYGDVAKWLRQGSAKPLSPVRFRPSPPVPGCERRALACRQGLAFFGWHQSTSDSRLSSEWGAQSEPD